MSAPPLDSSRRDVYKQLIHNLTNFSWKCLSFFHQLFQLLWRLLLRDGPSSHNSRVVLINDKEWNGDWVVSGFVMPLWAGRRLRGREAAQVPLSLVIRNVTSKTTKWEDDVSTSTFIPIIPHLSLLQNSFAKYFFKNKDLLGQVVKSNFAANQKKSHTFNSHHQSLKMLIQYCKPEPS